MATIVLMIQIKIWIIDAYLQCWFGQPYHSRKSLLYLWQQMLRNLHERSSRLVWEPGMVLALAIRCAKWGSWGSGGAGSGGLSWPWPRPPPLAPRNLISSQPSVLYPYLCWSQFHLPSSLHFYIIFFKNKWHQPWSGKKDEWFDPPLIASRLSDSALYIVAALPNVDCCVNARV